MEGTSRSGTTCRAKASRPGAPAALLRGVAVDPCGCALLPALLLTGFLRHADAMTCALATQIAGDVLPCC